MLEESFNGNLEDLLNVVLKKEVRISHYKHLQNLLDVYRYSPLKDSDISLPENQAFIKQEMQREDASSIKDYKQEAKAGTLLFDMTHQFINRFSKNDGGDKYQGLDRLDIIIDTCKDLLNTIEYKSIKIIIKYLRAEKIKRK
ncbi:TPA: hypothetical protein DCZ39_02040 [Patescibacteria group bacterium]|nr:hypothetical protein [Candidatus Gracilibacteria bacterium]